MKVLTQYRFKVARFAANTASYAHHALPRPAPHRVSECSVRRHHLGIVPPGKRTPSAFEVCHKVMMVGFRSPLFKPDDGGGKSPCPLKMQGLIRFRASIVARFYGQRFCCVNVTTITHNETRRY
jgi:hypothetical protein